MKQKKTGWLIDLQGRLKAAVLRPMPALDNMITEL